MYIVVGLLSIVALIAGFLFLNDATMGVGIIGIAGVLGILSRISQAEKYHKELIKQLEYRANIAEPERETAPVISPEYQPRGLISQRQKDNES